MRLAALAAALVVLAACAGTSGAAPLPAFTAPLDRDNPLVGTIWQPATGHLLTPPLLAEEAARADVLLLGETHDNPDAHALQAWLLRSVVESGRHPAVAFEMIEPSQSGALRDYLADHPGDASGLGDALGWEKAGWPEWRMYEPVMAAALAGGGPVEPANLDRADLRALAHGKAPEVAARLGLDRPLPPEVQKAMAAEIEDSHCGMLPPSAVPGMVQVQRARDAAMALALEKGLAGGRSAVLIAGSGHTRTDRGVPTHLEAKGRTVLSVAFVEAREGKTDPAAYAETFDADRVPFDVVVFIPRADREDPCEAFQRQMERKAK